LTVAVEYRHCPNCRAEYRPGPLICVDCGGVLVDGPSPSSAASSTPSSVTGAPGAVEVVERSEDQVIVSLDRFGLEEVPLVLTSMVEEDADAFLAALDEEEIGGRRGQPTGDGGVEIIVHASNLIDAQAVLVEFTGDVRLVDDIGVDEGADGDEDFAVVTWVRLADVGARANRLREQGVDVRIELPGEAERTSLDAQAQILVPIDALERAREILGIVF
jgi:hypothetical protein